jgi:hypothetical protein
MWWDYVILTSEQKVDCMLCTGAGKAAGKASSTLHVPHIVRPLRVISDMFLLGFTMKL